MPDFEPLSGAVKKELEATAAAIVKGNRGILAADESPGSMGNHMKKIGQENNPENRRRYREMIFTANPEELPKYIGGVIMHEETLGQKTSKGEAFPELFKSLGIVVGIKNDQGLEEMPNSAAKETHTKGLADLDDRNADYYEKGARFAKWRNVLKIKPDAGCPTDEAIKVNADELAKYAWYCQKNRLVPIVEPEIIPDGSHKIEVCAQVTDKVLKAVFDQLKVRNVHLPGILLKPNMVTPGHDCKERASTEEIGQKTVETLNKQVAKEVPGIVFLSGGQSEEEATINLNSINKFAQNFFKDGKHWSLTFSYGRALQRSALETWAGKQDNCGEAQKQLLKRAKACWQAVQGVYVANSAGTAAATKDNYAANRSY